MGCWINVYFRTNSCICITLKIKANKQKKKCQKLYCSFFLPLISFSLLQSPPLPFRLVSTPHCAAVCSFLPITSFPWYPTFPFWFSNNSDMTFPLRRDKWLCGPLLSSQHPFRKKKTKYQGGEKRWACTPLIHPKLGPPNAVAGVYISGTRAQGI